MQEEDTQRATIQLRINPRDKERIKDCAEVAYGLGLIQQNSIAEWLRYCLNAGITNLKYHYLNVREKVEVSAPASPPHQFLGSSPGQRGSQI